MSRLTFGGFELDPESGELWREGVCVRIQDQPLRLLLCLLEHPGQLVSREDLRQRIWSEAVHVDFEDGLNAAAWRLRQALGDSADRPRFIETVPRKGYRFLGTVRPLLGNPPLPSRSFPVPIHWPGSKAERPLRRPSRSRFRALAGALFLLMLAGVAGWRWSRPLGPSMEISSLVNETGDPAVDYFASALTHQVRQDLEARSGLRVFLRPGLPGSGGLSGPAGPRVTWRIRKMAMGYRILVELRDGAGNPFRRTVVEVPPERLHEVHQQIADFVANQGILR